jgi:hypothetical protein
MRERQTLLNNISATGNGNGVGWAGGPGVFSVEGTAGGTAAKLQMLLPQGNWVDVDPALTFTVFPNVYGFNVPQGQIRAVLTGGAPVSVFAYATSLQMGV